MSQPWRQLAWVYGELSQNRALEGLCKCKCAQVFISNRLKQDNISVATELDLDLDLRKSKEHATFVAFLRQLGGGFLSLGQIVCTLYRRFPIDPSKCLLRSDQIHRRRDRSTNVHIGIKCTGSMGATLTVNVRWDSNGEFNMRNQTFNRVSH